MANIVLTDCKVVFGGVIATGIGGTNFSDQISSVTISTVHDTVDITPTQSGSGKIYKEVIAGVGTNTVSFEFYQDFTDNALEEYFNGISNATSKVGLIETCFVRPKNTNISQSNPEYRFETLITEWTPLNGAVGQISTISVNWPISGAIEKYIL